MHIKHVSENGEALAGTAALPHSQGSTGHYGTCI